MRLSFRASCLVIISLLIPGTLRAEDIQSHARKMSAVGEAIRKYVGKTGHFPPAHIASADGKPLLSWRVIVLPYLGEQALFDKFQLDEPWDSPTNRKLIEQMPKLYHFGGGKVSGKTTLLALQPLPEHPVRTLSNTRKDVHIRDRERVTLTPYSPKGRNLHTFRNGVSAALAAVLAAGPEATEWSRPQDLTLNFKEPGPVKKRLATQNDQFLTLWGNGDVLGVPTSTSMEKLLVLFDYHYGSGARDADLQAKMQSKHDFLNTVRKAKRSYWRNENWRRNGFNK